MASEPGLTEKPKSPSKLAQPAARYNEFCCKQRNSRNLRSKTCHIFPAKPSGLPKMGLEGDLGKLCTHEASAAWLAQSRERQSAEREVAGSNTGRTNNQGL